MDKRVVFKWGVKALIYACLFVLFIYGLLNVEPPDKKHVIDTRVAYEPGTIASKIADYVSVPDGGVPWGLFLGTKRIDYKYTDVQGDEQEGVRPDFSQELQALDGQEIILQGYMFPLNSGEEQTVFLFGPFPMSCPFQYHVGPELVIDVQSAENIGFQLDAITLKGRLELVPRDDEYGVFYRLKGARLVR